MAKLFFQPLTTSRTARDLSSSRFLRNQADRRIVLGAYADRHGRKATLLLTISLMTLGTAVMAPFRLMIRSERGRRDRDRRHECFKPLVGGEFGAQWRFWLNRTKPTAAFGKLALFQQSMTRPGDGFATIRIRC